jgi:hypothetical protein
MLFYGVLVEILRLPFDDLEGILGALSQTGPQPITELLSDEPGFPVYDLYSALGTGRNTYPTAITCCFVDFDDLPFNFHFSLLLLFLPKRTPR